MLDPLPIDEHVPEVAAALLRARAVVITAAPGAGKTTRVPPALVDAGPLILLQPRRVAARTIAQRIAYERGWTVGREIGWQIRFERRFAPDTQLLVATEGVLTARLQHDPLLSDFRTIVLDEFHERSIHADLAIALTKQAWRVRDDLRIVVMSATLDAAVVSRFLGDCPVIDVPGRLYPIDIRHEPSAGVADAALRLLDETGGHVLCFLPGAPEIRRAVSEIEARAARGSVEVVPLHGSLDADGQDAALRPASHRRIIVSTNIAETSVTVPGVTAVVDSGWHKVARYDADRGIDSLELERITRDAADQRAGRAGRIAPGRVVRLWDERDRLRPHREPEIFRVDLSAPALDVIAWGGDPRAIEWFEAPRADAIDAALALLARLGLIDVRHPQTVRLTPMGDQVRRLPLPPRLARMLIEAGGGRQIAQACAILSERHLLPPRAATTPSDLLSALDNWRDMPPHVKAVADHIARSAIQSGIQSEIQSGISNLQSEISIVHSFCRAIFSGYPDRVAQRREPGSARVRLATSAGAVLSDESGVREGEFLVAVDVHALPGPGGSPPRPGATDADARIRVASRVEREWLKPTRTDIVHRFDRDSGSVRAARVDYYDALVLADTPVTPDAEAAAALLAAEWLRRGPNEADMQLIRRLRFAGHKVDLATVARDASYGVRRLADIDLRRAIAPDLLRALDRDAPESVDVPSGRTVRLDYADDGSVLASVKLQELFGLADTPAIGPRRVPVLLALLAPNGRPVQLTRDLKSFWARTYPEVRKELRGRYPKHPWPDDPWTAIPSARAKPRPRS